MSHRSVVRDSLGVGVAVGAYGFAFGAASVAAGLSVLQTCLFSLLAFTGGTQFAVVGVIAGGGGVAAALAGGLLLGSRNTLYAMRLAPVLQVRGVRRLAAALGTIDESTAMAVAQDEPPLARVAFWWTFGGVFVCWNLTTLFGALVGSLVDPRAFGLDAVVPAAFLALVAPRLRAGMLERRIAVGAVVIAAVLIPFTPPGVPVLAACAALAAGCDGARMTLWTLVVATIVGCYLLKLAGYLVPARVLDRPRVRRAVELLPVALLAALVVVELIADGRRLDLDAPRLVGFAAAAVAVWRRAPFLVVVVTAGLVTALLRLA